MRPLLFIDQWLERIFGWLLVLFLYIMIGMSFGQVVLRNLFDTSIDWGDIFLRHLVLWVGYFGAVIATGQRRHLKVEFLTKIVPSRVCKAFFIVTNLFAAFICCLLMQASISFVQMEMAAGSILILNLPSWCFVIVIPIGYAAAAFRFAIHSLRWITEIFKGNWEIEEVRPS